MIRFIIKLYIYLIILDAILSFFPSIQYYNWVKAIKKIANYTLNPIRKILPKEIPFDISPIVMIFILNLLMLLW